jgi:hypothetical protein
MKSGIFEGLLDFEEVGLVVGLFSVGKVLLLLQVSKPLTIEEFDLLLLLDVKEPAEENEEDGEGPHSDGIRVEVVSG